MVRVWSLSSLAPDSLAHSCASTAPDPTLLAAIAPDVTHDDVEAADAHCAIPVSCDDDSIEAEVCSVCLRVAHRQSDGACSYCLSLPSDVECSLQSDRKSVV